MIIKTKLINIEIEWLFIIVILVTLFSSKIEKLLDVFYMCYFFIFFHELAHILVAGILGKTMDKIKFSLAGVCVTFSKSLESEDKLTKAKNIAIYLAGPLSNVALALVFRDNKMIFNINMFLALLNCIFISPLDGYNVLKSFLEIFVSEEKVKIILIIVSNCIFILAILLAIYQIIFYRMASLTIFIVYLYLLKKTGKKEVDFDKILHKVTS